MTAVDALALSEGDTVLVVGATGGVGSLAVQLAARAGATVVAPALPEDEEYLRGLGVGELLDRDVDVAAAVRERHPGGVDALLDLVSYAPGAFDAALADGARVASPNGAAGDGPGRTNVMSVASTENLARVAQLLEDGNPPGARPGQLRARPRRRGAARARHEPHPGQARRRDRVAVRATGTSGARG